AIGGPCDAVRAAANVDTGGQRVGPTVRRQLFHIGKTRVTGTNMHAMLPLLRATDFPAIRRKSLETLQVNLGYRCNQSCTHCHVAAGPNRTEEMSAHNVEAVLTFLEEHRVPTLDITG